jgi:peptidoglycan/LPS O-acetylase OafA/YrhL
MSDPRPIAPVRAQVGTKLSFIESLRGLAACQVMVLHYCAAFLPMLARVPGPAHFAAEPAASHSPLFLLLDGYSAVYLFFVMSGFVLAPSFLRAPQPAAALVAKRFTRLFLPVLAAFLCAVLLKLALPDAAADAQRHSQSGWLAALGHNPMNWRALASDGLWNAMLAGYQGMSVFSPWPALAAQLGLNPIASAMNPPMWTLHVEFWGSMLLILLARSYRRLPPLLFWLGFVLLAWIAGTGHFLLFLAGFGLYQLHQPLLRWRHGVAPWMGGLLVAAGLAVCASKQLPLLSLIWERWGHAGLLSAESDFHWQSQVGALLVFFGVLLCAPLRQLLDHRATLWLGRLSFSIYLLHFPILMTVGCLIFSQLAPLSYGLACAVSLLAGGGLTILCAQYFERWIDRQSVAASRRI